MRWQFAGLLVASIPVGVFARRSPAHAGIQEERDVPRVTGPRGVPSEHWTRNGPIAKRFANANTTRKTFLLLWLRRRRAV